MLGLRDSAPPIVLAICDTLGTELRVKPLSQWFMKDWQMRITLAAILVICWAPIAGAQVSSSDQAAGKSEQKSEHSTGRATTPEPKGQLQPQGWTGPIETTSGGAPAESPQGQSPPGMQAAPEGSSKTVVAPAK